ncbi:MAG TPA: nucleotidyltransferase family protein [Bacteroidales bacterium]
MGAIWAIILAAGESKRMGFPKMFLTFNGKTMIENVITNICRSAVNKTLVVLGAEKDSLIDLIGKLPVLYCYNDKYKDGMLSSVKYGFRNLPSDYSAVLVFQGDQPFITPETINAIIKAYLFSGKGIVIPTFQNKRGHPLLIDIKYRGEIEKLCDSKGLRSLADKFSDDVLEVDTDDSGILRDFDTFEEYEMEINQIQ